MNKNDVAIVGIGRTPYSRAKPGERIYTVDEYIAWAADLALKSAGMGKDDFNGQGLGVAHAEAAHTVNWSAATAETLGISPQILLRADQGGASATAMLIRAAAMIRAGVVDRVLVVGADTPLSIPSAAPGLPLSPERTRGTYWDFQGPFGVMGATAQFALVLQRYMHQFPGLRFETLGKIATSNRYHATLHPGAIYRQPMSLDDYMASRMLSDPIRLLDCVPIVNGGLAYIVTSGETARKLTDRPVWLRGFGEANNYYHGKRTLPDITTTGFASSAPAAMQMAGVKHDDIDFFQPYDDYPFISMMTMEDWGFCKKGQGAKFVEERNFRFDGDFPLSTDGGQLSGGQPGGAIGGFMPLVEAVTQLRGEADQRQVKKARIGAVCGFGGIPYGRPGRSCIAIVLGNEG
ncbi:thiolase family protein [Alicycliphilus denitrificans]|uniref:Thiolase family protein n=1 Tax=Alicycliphilus denitrificans TaxID=179636 RepID=A0A858ZZB6_9BURK|nr:thiolase family protein [Alicycliphilus denitrificans]QKD45721.1 thiolase family protein [Alicycliphilus denitrificans]